MMLHGLALAHLVLSLSVLETTARCGRTTVAHRHQRMVNGDRTAPHQYPWMVSIQMENRHHCGGVLINDLFVLSAAHCFDYPNDVVKVLFGAHSWTSEGFFVSASVLLHPLYTPGRYTLDENDIALVKLHEAVPISSEVRPICLPRADDRVAVRDDVFALGWGLTTPTYPLNFPEPDHHDENATESPWRDQLQQLPLQVGNTTECVQQIVTYERYLLDACKRGEIDMSLCKMLELTGTPGPISYGERDPVMLCAVSPPNGAAKRSLCNGDSGGPLMKQRADGSWVVVGIISDGARGCITFPESYQQTGELCTDVLHLKDWIQSSIKSFDSSSSNCSSRRFVGHVAVYFFIVIIRLMTLNGRGYDFLCDS